MVGKWLNLIDVYGYHVLVDIYYTGCLHEESQGVYCWTTEQKDLSEEATDMVKITTYQLIKMQPGSSINL